METATETPFHIRKAGLNAKSLTPRRYRDDSLCRIITSSTADVMDVYHPLCIESPSTLVTKAISLAKFNRMINSVVQTSLHNGMADKNINIIEVLDTTISCKKSIGTITQLTL